MAVGGEASRVTNAHLRYLAERTRGEDRFLRKLREVARKEGIPPIAISAEQGSFMQILLQLGHARDVVEVGTLAGYSAIWMARALPPDGQVRTIELSDQHAEFAERWIARSDVARKVTVYRGAGRDLLPTFRSHSADAAFLDADKSSYPLYLREALRIVRPGGLVMVDNAFAFGQLFEKLPSDREVKAVRRFNEIMANEKAVQSIIVPVGDGLWVGVKKR